MMKNEYQIKSESEMEAVIGASMEIVKSKILTQLDHVMKEFVNKSPLIFISTIP